VVVEAWLEVMVKRWLEVMVKRWRRRKRIVVGGVILEQLTGT